MYSYIGYQRDTIAVSLGGRFFKGDELTIFGELSRISHGEHRLYYDWANNEQTIAERTPTGIPENKYIGTIGAKWKMNSYLTYNGSFTGIYSINNNHNEGINELGGQVSFSINFHY